MNTTFTNTLKTLALGLVMAASVHSAMATPITHTYVSSMGSDGNACTHASPCATFQGALAKTSPGGVVTAIDAGDYGQVTSIAHAVTIDGTGTQASIVTNNSTDAIAISAPAAETVILRHITLTGLPGSSSGIDLFTGALVVDDCKISGFSSVGAVGIHVLGGSVIVTNTTITGCYEAVANSALGLLSLRNVALLKNEYGLVTYGGSADISHSLISQNDIDGLFASGGSSTLSVSNCMISGNATAVSASSGAVVRLTGNDLFNNTVGLETNGGAGIVSTAGNNHKAGSTTPGAPTPGKVIVTQ